MSRPGLLEAERSVLVVVDLQTRLMDQVFRPDLVRAATQRLLSLAQIFGVPVILTEQYPKGLGETEADILEAFDALTVPRRRLEKVTFGCCGDDGFRSALKEMAPVEVPQVVVAGIEAHVCVLQTVFPLLAEGAEVHLCWDAVSGRGEEYRREALQRMARAGAQITNHESVGFEWARTKDHEGFRALNRLLREGQPG